MSQDLGNRLYSAAKKNKLNPVAYLAVFELVEDECLKFQNERMMDEKIPPDEKGRIAMTVNHILMSMRAKRVAVQNMVAVSEKPAPHKLHNPHLQ